MRKVGIRKGNISIWFRRVICLALASLSLITLNGCKNKENENVEDTPTPPTISEVVTPTPTEIVVETPTPIAFSYEDVFNETFSDEELSKLYPDIQDFNKERERIYSNISRIEDFEFYGLTEEEQISIKDAQLNNLQTNEIEIREVLTKILQNDPYVFDDVDNEVKIDNRIKIIIPKMKEIHTKTTEDLSVYDSETSYESIKNALLSSNCGKYENPSIESVYIDAGKNVNKNYFYEFVLPDYKNNDWKGNYIAFDFSILLLDGSNGEKIAKELYNANEKFYKSDKKDVKKSLKEFENECIGVLLANDVLNKPNGISSASTRMHYAIIYSFCVNVLHFVSGEMRPNDKFTIPKECAEKLGLSKTKFSLNEIKDLLCTYLGSGPTIDNQAIEELIQAQIKYENQNTLDRLPEN